MKQIKRLSAIGTGALLAIPGLAGAVDSVPTFNPQPAASGTTWQTILVNIINVTLYIAGAIALLFLIIGGIRYMISSGNSDQMEKAKHTVLYAIIGILIVVFAWVIINVIIGLGKTVAPTG